MVNEDLINEIDSVHKSANDALRLKQFDRYMECFSDDLQYKQLNGKTIGKKQLVNDTRHYFGRIQNYSGSYKREDYSIEKNSITERLIQYTKVSIRVFIFFSKNWTVEREGIYQWVKVNDSWKISRVDILKEKLS